MAAWQQPSPLDDIIMDLKLYINIPNLRPLFRCTHLLTDSELEQLEISANNPTDQAVDRLVTFVRRKGPDHAEKFLELLQKSLQEPGPHMGHDYLCQRLEKVIRERKQEVESQRRAMEQPQPPGPQPLHRGVTHTDSGVMVHGSPCSRSSRSESCNSSRTDIGIEADDNLDRDSMFNNHHDQMSSKRHLSVPGLSDVRYGRSREGLDQQHFKTMEDFKNITTCFAMMVLALYRTLKKINAPIDEVRITLMYLGCEPGKSKEESMRLFPSSDEFAEAKDIGSLIECLRSYSSWYNYRLMKIVAEQFADEEGKKLIADYEDNLRKYYVNLIVSQCPKFTLGQGLPPGYTELIVKVNWDYQSSRLQDIVLFQSNLAELLELEPYVFQLRSIEEGCVLITWAIPTALEQLVANLTAVQREFLETQGVLYLQTATVFTRIAFSRGEHSLPVDVGCKPPPSTHASNENITSEPCSRQSPLSSSSSSLASVLDLPMTEIEAELLSNYSGDAEDSCKRSLMQQSDVQLDKEEEDLEMSGDTSVSHFSTAADEVFGQDWERSAARMAKNYYSEDNLLSPPSAESQHNKNNSLSRRAISKFSLPDLGRKRATPSGCSRSSEKKCCCSKSILHSLKKAPSKLFLKLFRSSRPTPVLSEETLCDPEPTPQEDFPIFQLMEEPKGSWYQYVLLSPTAADSPGFGQIGSRSLAICIPNIVTNPSTSPPEARETMSLIPSTTSEMQHLHLNIDSHSSLRSSLPTPLTDLSNAERADTRHSSLTSGIASVSPSMISRHSFSQTSVESEERSSLCSSDHHFGDTRKDSVISEHSTLYSSPIYEHPCEVRGHLLSEIPEQTQDYIPFLERNRAHSYGEDFYHKTRPRVSSAVSHSGSSGYSSWANSNVSSTQSSMVRVNTSQESLEAASPFPCPRVATVKRGGSLKAYSRYSTREFNRYHVKSHQSQ